MKTGKFIIIDEEGYALFDELRIQDPEVGHEILEQLRPIRDSAWMTTSAGVDVDVEAFDEPLVALRVDRDSRGWRIQAPYEFTATFDPSTLRVDEWDRFHGRTDRGIPFVFSRSAQAAFFDMLEAFDDDSVTIDGRRMPIAPLYSTEAPLGESKFWTGIYLEEGKPGWDLGAPSVILKDMLPRLKLAKSRVLVLGCGEGHDAAEFAREGHLVTAVDFSEEALRRAQEHYGTISNIQWVHGDVFALGPKFENSHDIVFEHTCFCAIDPARRQELVQVWRRALTPGGHLMGVFFVMDKLTGPPFGATEWELRERLKKHFRFLFWGRWRASLERRQGKELFVYAQSLKK